MRYLTLLRANCKSQKGSLIGVLTLIFIITISLCATLAIWKNSNVHERELIEQTGYGDIAWWVSQVPDVETLLSEIRAVEGVEKATAQELIYISRYYVNGQGVEGTLEVLSWEDCRNSYHVCADNLTGILSQPQGPAEGEVYVSPAFCSLYDAHIGDSFVLEISGEQTMVSYTIKGYFEDPRSGSSMMGIKSILMNGKDMTRLSEVVEAAEDPAASRTGHMLNVYMTADNALTIGAFESKVNSETAIQQFSLFSYSKTAIIGFMLVLQNVFSGFLLAFVVVLLAVTMVIIGHSISSSIEQDYVDMGILKALGFTQADLRRLQLLQYMTAVLSGMALGAAVSPLVVSLINRITVTATGLIIPSDIPIGISVLAISILLLLLIGFIYAKTAKIGRITPIRAIRGGAEDVYFSSRFTAAVHRRGLSFWLALRQLVSGKKQYIGACLIAAMLVFFLSLTVRIDAWMGPNGEGLMTSFNAAPYDFGIVYTDRSKEAEIESFIAEHAAVKGSFQQMMTRGVIDGVEYLMYVNRNPEYYNLIEGRTCKYKNELVITESVAEELSVWTGDTVHISYTGQEQEFLVSGIYQCANDMGGNFGISSEGFARLCEEDSNPDSAKDSIVNFSTYYLLEEPSQKDALCEMLTESYGEWIVIDENTWGGLDSVRSALSSLTVFMYVITMIFIMVTVTLTGNKILYKEQRDLGIYKSLGFVSGRLRLAFALRFGLVAVAGAVPGVAISAFFTDRLVASLLKMCGISRFSSSLSPLQAVLPAIVVSGLFLVFAYMAAGKVKKVEVGMLIAEA